MKKKDKKRVNYESSRMSFVFVSSLHIVSKKVLKFLTCLEDFSSVFSHRFCCCRVSFSPRCICSSSIVYWRRRLFQVEGKRARHSSQCSSNLSLNLNFFFTCMIMKERNSKNGRMLCFIFLTHSSKCKQCFKTIEKYTCNICVRRLLS